MIAHPILVALVRKKPPAQLIKQSFINSHQYPRIHTECASAHAYQGHSAPKWVSYMYMVVFTLKFMCTICNRRWVPTPNMHWHMVRNVAKAVRYALAHAVWPRGTTSH